MDTAVSPALFYWQSSFPFLLPLPFSTAGSSPEELQRSSYYNVYTLEPANGMVYGPGNLGDSEGTAALDDYRKHWAKL